ncbi:LysR family transcriptional regulator [Cupriavidus sp. MP-37]|uniref:LysR family transcriptional regulator n=1 Tax=Cupriavidus sp. MP-37 TaxID=2884455 RepID=UPI001D0AC093|nr:LysR family transcriptional regulator [Cupriavidus sp. MP-37]UDM53602.1 LysR family transcriptional regulator [Cupriavidus sp. MP-37]
METRDIEYILAVAAHGGIGRAAEALGISQPALTKAVQRVEAQAGLPLFERTANGMAATYAGTRFLERARRIQLEFEDGIKEMLGIRTGEQGILRVGYSPSIPGHVILDACRQLVRERPVARLRLRRRLARDLLDLLAAGDLDMAVAPTPSGALAATFAVQPLFDDRLVVVADEGHALLRRRKLRLADLAEQEWLLPESHITLRQQVDAAFRQRGLPEPQPRIEIDFGSTSLFALMQGTQMLSIANAGGEAMQRGLRVLPLGVEELDLRRRIGVVTRAGAYQSPLAQRLTVLLREHSRPA